MNKPYGFSTQAARERRQEKAAEYWPADDENVISVSYRHTENKRRHVEHIALPPNERAHWPYIALYKLRMLGIPAARVRIEE